jgi:hypothetical protein
MHTCRGTLRATHDDAKMPPYLAVRPGWCNCSRRRCRVVLTTPICLFHISSVPHLLLLLLMMMMIIVIMSVRHIILVRIPTVYFIHSERACNGPASAPRSSALHRRRDGDW